MKIDLEQIKSLLNVVGQTDITELSIESGEEKITIKKGHAGIPVMMEAPAMTRQISAPAAVQATSAPEPAVHEEENNGKALIPITSPMVGTFYRAPSPTAQPFVAVGDVIAPGQTVCIIEAMKLMNDLPAEVAGRVVKICVEDGTTVEYGQPLFMVNPKG